MITSYYQVINSDFFYNLYSKRKYSDRKTQLNDWQFLTPPPPCSSQTLPLQITTFQWFGVGHFSKEGECFESNVFQTP